MASPWFVGEVSCSLTRLQPVDCLILAFLGVFRGDRGQFFTCFARHVEPWAGLCRVGEIESSNGAT